ncbi:MAG: transglycosylase SLT domain-containing protein [Pseudomonadota bacterium]
MQNIRSILLSGLFLLLLEGSLIIKPPIVLCEDQPRQLIFCNFPLPKTLNLCGEPIPLENLTVREMLDREFTLTVWEPRQVMMWLKRAGRYFPFIEKRLHEEGMPDDLKYLSVAESSLLIDIRSSAGALGPWQFMSRTAYSKGLRKDRDMDERLDFERSTDAALHYLKELKEQFGTWTLALAAYNCGEARLEKEIKEQRVNDYYRLNLPKETERFIFRIATVKIILQDPKLYGYSLEGDHVYKPIQTDTVSVTISMPIHITELAEAIGTDFKVIKELNPQIIGYYLPRGKYTLKVPVGSGAKAAKVLNHIGRKKSLVTKEISHEFYVVKQGDTLSRIAGQTGVPVETLKRLNGLKGSHLLVGQKLRLMP